MYCQEETLGEVYMKKELTCRNPSSRKEVREDRAFPE